MTTGQGQTGPSFASSLRFAAGLAVVAAVTLFYLAPSRLAISLQPQQPPRPGQSASLVAERVDFPRVNAQLGGDLRQASGGHLDPFAFATLLFYGALGVQRARPLPLYQPPTRPGEIATAAPAAEVWHSPSEAYDENAAAPQTRLVYARYRTIDRFVAIFWDKHYNWEVALWLQRPDIFGRWTVVKVTQYRGFRVVAGGTLITAIHNGWPRWAHPLPPN